MIKSSQQWPAAMISKKNDWQTERDVEEQKKKKLIEPQLGRNKYSKSWKSSKITKKTMKNNEKPLNILAQGAQGDQNELRPFSQ